MTRLTKMTRRCAFTLAEALIALAIGLALFALVQWASVSSGRVLARGQNKLFDAGTAELLFRHLENDLQAAASAPAVQSAPPQLVIQHPATADAPAATIEWHFDAAPAGRRSTILRRVSGGTGARPLVICRDTLSGADIRPVKPGGCSAILVRVTFESPPDASPVTFQQTFFSQNHVPDPAWNPVTER
jgi:hypothetical protein